MLGFVTPFSFAQTSTESGKVYNPNKVLYSPRPYDWCDEHGCGYGDPNPTLPPEMKCGTCAELHSIKTEVKPSQVPSPSPSGTDVKGIEATPKPTVRAAIRPSVKPVISPSPLSSPSASISASPSAVLSPELFRQKETWVIESIWNWVLKLFKMN